MEKERDVLFLKRTLANTVLKATGLNEFTREGSTGEEGHLWGATVLRGQAD